MPAWSVGRAQTPIGSRPAKDDRHGRFRCRANPIPLLLFISAIPNIDAVGFRLAKLVQARFDRSYYDAEGTSHHANVAWKGLELVLDNPDYGLDRRSWTVGFDFTRP